MRVLSVLLAVALLLVGCSAELPEQEAARNLVEIHVSQLDGYDGEVHCTRNPRAWFVEREATVSICTARRDDGDCDWFRVTDTSPAPAVTLERRRGGCVLPL